VNGNGCGTPEVALDQAVGIDSQAANDEAAAALLGMITEDAHAQSAACPALHSSTVDSRMHAKDGDGVPAHASPLAAATVAKGDDISVERARYLQSKQKHSAEGSTSANSSAGKDGDCAPPMAKIVSSKLGGKWGSLVVSPRSSAANLSLVKLGEREDDPKKRLEQTCRNSLGAFAGSASQLSVGAAVGSDGRHNPPSRTVRPTKSALRTPSSDLETACSVTSATSSIARPIRWCDMEGKGLFTRHTYEGEGDSASPP
jgi:hypothetical protein